MLIQKTSFILNVINRRRKNKFRTLIDCFLFILVIIEIPEVPDVEVGLGDAEREITQIQSRCSFNFSLGGKNNNKVCTPTQPIFETFLTKSMSPAHRKNLKSFSLLQWSYENVKPYKRGPYKYYSKTIWKCIWKCLKF